MANYQKQGGQVHVVKALHKPIINKPYDQSKVLAKFDYVEESYNRSPVYNLIYPEEMLLNKPC